MKTNREWTRINAKLVTGRVRSMWPSNSMDSGCLKFQRLIAGCRFSSFKTV
jgi:hypothetical protein